MEPAKNPIQDDMSTIPLADDDPQGELIINYSGLVRFVLLSLSCILDGRHFFEEDLPLLPSLYNSTQY